MKQPLFYVFLGVLIFLVCFASTVLVKEYFSGPISRKGDDIIYYYRIGDDLDYTKPSLPLIQAMQDMAETYKLKQTSDYYATNFILFETLNMVDEAIKAIMYPREMLYIYGVCGSDLMASKSSLAMVLRSYYKEHVGHIMPRTYILEGQRDLDIIMREFNDRKVYIMKQNVQRQEGNTLTNKLEDIVNAPIGVVCVQEMLQEPYLVNERKINIRVYMLVVVGETKKARMYMYNDGFLYYTPKKFQQLSLDKDATITTGYIDRSVYIENPMTMYDLSVHMKRKSHSYSALFANISALMAKVAKAFAPLIEKENSKIPGVKFLVYGCDVAPDKDLEVKLMEINKGPDLNYKDDRDKGVKLNMLREAFMIAGFAHRTMHNFEVLV